MDNLLLFNIIADICGVIFSLVGLTAMIIWRKFLDKTFKFSLFLFLTNSVALLSNLFGLLLKGKSGGSVYILLRITNFLEFTAGYTLAFLFTIFLFYFLETKGIVIKNRMWLYVSYFLVLSLLVVSQFNGMFYYIDSNNIYHRGELFFLSQLFGVMLTVIAFVIVLRYKSYMSKREVCAFIFYTVFPIAALVFQMFSYGIYILLLTTTIGMFLLFIMILTAQVSQYYEKEREISDMKYLLLQSQLQPHFLFNSLVTIKHLCKTDPDSAAQAVEDFSYFLRGNLDSITARDCIPFSSELEHTKNYISLEEKRFGSRLNVDFDLKETEFCVPALTIQPIVENAIKYGTMQKMEGVSVLISTCCDDRNYYVKIIDNGMGFDKESYKSDRKKHIGLEGVRHKLMSMCNGKLVIDSVMGKGTQVTISIPKEGK